MAAVIKELHQLSEGKKNGLSPHFFVEFLRTRVSELAANEVQMEINSILSDSILSDEKGKDKEEADSSRNDIVLLRSGISISEGGKSVRIKLSTAEALVARKLHLVTGASFEEDRKQLVDDIVHLEEILASSTSESVAVETLLQAALGGHDLGVDVVGLCLAAARNGRVVVDGEKRVARNHRHRLHFSAHAAGEGLRHSLLVDLMHHI